MSCCGSVWQRALLADVDQVGARGHELEHLLGDQVVVEHDAGLGQHARRLHRQQFGVARPGADERHARRAQGAVMQLGREVARLIRDGSSAGSCGLRGLFECASACVLEPVQGRPRATAQPSLRSRTSQSFKRSPARPPRRQDRPSGPRARLTTTTQGVDCMHAPHLARLGAAALLARCRPCRRARAGQEGRLAGRGELPGRRLAAGQRADVPERRTRRPRR